MNWFSKVKSTVSGVFEGILDPLPPEWGSAAQDPCAGCCYEPEDCCEDPDDCDDCCGDPENCEYDGCGFELGWEEAVVDWAEARNLIEGSTPNAQVIKLVEELAELCEAIRKNEQPEAADAIGDCSVVLCIIAAQLGLEFGECLWGAYDQIKDRKGRMIDGIFVKEEDLPEPTELPEKWESAE